MPLQVYSTLTRKKEPFPKQPGEAVTMYVCGPTVYKPSHIGHMVGPVIFDTIKRYLTYLGYKVTWVVNITDVDDKLIKRAAELKTNVPELANTMTADYLECLKKLNVTNVDKFPKATEHIDAMKAMIAKLIEKGYAYAAAGDVYFDVSKDADYGKLCNRDPEQLEAGARIEVSDRKRSPGDFALWKGAKPGEPKEVIWDSPWGPGRPGWHIECSAMSQALLGETIDIHGGGLDLQFPHHENELAQSESANGKAFARVWMHNGLLKMGTAKMAGSIGNVVNIKDLLERHSPETVRLLLLSTHYRSPIEYSEERLNEVAKALQGFYRFFERYQRVTGKSFCDIPVLDMLEPGYSQPFETPLIANAWGMFQHFMDDDFNTAGALGQLFGLVSAANKLADGARIEDSQSKDEPAKIAFIESAQLVKQLGHILGLFWAPPPEAKQGGDDAFVGGLMQLFVDLRNNLRAEAKKIAVKDDPTKKALFEQTDIIRKRLGELGVVLEDRPGGTTWRRG